MDPLLKDIPDTFESDRLTIRVSRAGDGPATNAAVCASLETLKPWMPWAQKAPTLEESEAICRRDWANFLLRKDMTLRLFLKGTPTMIGSSGFHDFDWRVPKCEIGYWVGKEFEGKGYATEAVRRIAAFGLETLGMIRVQICVDPANVRSRSVAERAGFSLESILRNECRDVAGELRDTCVYTRLGKP